MNNNRTEFLNRIYQAVPFNKEMFFKPQELLKMVVNCLRENKVFMSDIKEINVIEGALFLNDIRVGIICDFEPKKTNYIECNYWENKILKAQEIY